MGETADLVSCTREIFDEGREMFDYGVIVGRVVTGDAEDLT